MHLDGAHLFGDVLARALYQPLAQVGGELRPCVGGDVDAAAQRAAHVGGNLRTAFISIEFGMKMPAVRPSVIHRQFYRDNRAVVFQRGNFDVEPFALYLARAYHHCTAGY